MRLMGREPNTMFRIAKCFLTIALICSTLMSVTRVEAKPNPSPSSHPPLRAPTIPIIVAVEPTNFVNTNGGTLSIIGDNIVTGTVVRLVGYGVLPTEFINTGSLRAIVPIGIFPRRYSIELIEPDGTTVVTQFYIDVTGPTPTPGLPVPTNPPPTPVPGQPLFTLRNFYLDPPRPIVGREFTLTVEIYNTGSRAGENTLVTFSGGNFTPVGNNGYLLGQVHINAVSTLTQRFRVPMNLQSQLHELKFNISANDWEGKNFQFPQTVPVEVIGIYPGKPQLVIENARTEPAQLRAGQPFTLLLDIANRGSRTAVNTLVSLAPTTDVLPATTGNALSIDYVNVDHFCTITIPLVLAQNAGAGLRQLDLSFDYTDYVGTQAYSQKQTVSINIADTLLDRPQIVLSGYRTEPRLPAPGEPFTVTYQLSNVGGGDAKRLTAALGGESGANLRPFSPVNSGNVKFVSSLKSGATFEVQQVLIADAASDSGAFSLPVALSYDDSRDQRRTENQVMSLLIRRVPTLRVTFNPPVAFAVVGQPVQLPFEITNIGRRLLNVNTVDVTSEQMEIQNSTQFIGVIDAGQSAPALQPPIGIPKAPGEAQVVVTINYLDELSQPQQVTRTLSVQIQDAPPTPPNGQSRTDSLPQNPFQDDSPLVIRILRALFGLGS